MADGGASSLTLRMIDQDISRDDYTYVCKSFWSLSPYREVSARPAQGTRYASLPPGLMCSQANPFLQRVVVHHVRLAPDIARISRWPNYVMASDFPKLERGNWASS